MERLSYYKTKEEWTKYVEDLQERVELNKDDMFEFLKQIYDDHFDIFAYGEESGCGSFFCILTYEDCFSFGKMMKRHNEIVCRSEDNGVIPLFEMSRCELAFMDIIYEVFKRVK